MNAEDAVPIDLTDAERHVLARGFAEWGGPTHCTDALAVAMDFDGAERFHVEGRRLSRSIRDGQALSRRDWRRALIATEIAFASDVFGSGVDWSTTTGLSDEETIKILRSYNASLRGQQTFTTFDRSPAAGPSLQRQKAPPERHFHAN